MGSAESHFSAMLGSAGEAQSGTGQETKFSQFQSATKEECINEH